VQHRGWRQENRSPAKREKPVISFLDKRTIKKKHTGLSSGVLSGTATWGAASTVWFLYGIVSIAMSN
jgi:hypothetical protein